MVSIDTTMNDIKTSNGIIFMVRKGHIDYSTQTTIVDIWLGAIISAPSRYCFDKNLSSLFIASFRESKE